MAERVHAALGRFARLPTRENGGKAEMVWSERPWLALSGRFATLPVFEGG